jgi:hypothetical protein
MRCRKAESDLVRITSVEVEICVTMQVKPAGYGFAAANVLYIFGRNRVMRQAASAVMAQDPAYQDRVQIVDRRDEVKLADLIAVHDTPARQLRCRIHIRRNGLAMLRESGRMAARVSGQQLMFFVVLLGSNVRSSDVRYVFECYRVPAL